MNASHTPAGLDALSATLKSHDKWATLSAAFTALNEARPELLRMRCTVCAPSRTLNGIGEEVQAHFGPRVGWLAVSAPYPCRCAADTALVSVPDDGTERRVYESLAERAA